MLKWLLLIGVIMVAAFWVKRNRSKSVFSEPEIKEVEQNRFYIKPPESVDRPADDHQNDRY